MKKQSKTMSSRAGLMLSASKASRRLRDAVPTKGRVSKAAPVVLSAVTECIIGELFQVAAEGLKNRKRVMVSDLTHAMRADRELHQMAAGFAVLSRDQVRKVASVVNPPPPESTDAGEADE